MKSKRAKQANDLVKKKKSKLTSSKQRNPGTYNITDPLKIIRQLKKHYGVNLKEVELKDISRFNSYSLDDNGHMVGLNLFCFGITDIEFLRHPAFAHLTYLSLSQAQITDISHIKHLNHLEELYLLENDITDISPLRHLSHLTELWLALNQIKDISPLKDLKNLKVVTLMKNQISQLPRDITQWGLEIKWGYRIIGEEGIFLKGNPLEEPPIEIVKQGTEAVRNYFMEMEADQVFLLESKVLLVGNGEVGKTTLMKKLMNPSYTVEIGKEPPTHGINIKPWTLKCPFPSNEEQTVNVHFWDFGGQAIYHATHQFFLTKRSLYLFVWEARREDEALTFDYWLNIVNLLCGQSPIIIVMNKSDVRVKSIDERSFQEKYPNIVAFINVSCISGDNIDKLTELIRKTLGTMPHLKDKLPKVWKQIRDNLKKLDKDHISLNEYFDICWEYKLDKDRALFLSDYLHDLGAILHFRHDKLLKDTVILKAEWATEAVYKLIDTRQIQADKGKFKFDDLETYWDTQKYPWDRHPQLIRLMERFELCFNFLDTSTYFVPELLPAKMPLIKTNYQNPHTLRFEYRYDFMPDGIVSRFISRLFYLIHEEHFWKNGVELHFEDSTALVICYSLQRKIHIAAVGSNKSELLAIIRNDLDRIHQTLDMEKGTHYDEFIPCPCKNCYDVEKPHFFEYSNLKNFIKKDRSSIQCQKSGDMIPIGQLLKNVETAAPTTDLYQLIIECAYHLQGISLTVKPEEDSRNTLMSILLESKGLYVKDQTRWGVSESGKSLGEVDIKIEGPHTVHKAIIEAFILKNCNHRVIDLHLKKLFGYDPSGLRKNYLLVYSEAADFSHLWERYIKYITKVDYPFPIIGKPNKIETHYIEIKSALVRHKRGSEEAKVYHIFINLKNVKKSTRNLTG